MLAKETNIEDATRYWASEEIVQTTMIDAELLGVMTSKTVQLWRLDQSQVASKIIMVTPHTTASLYRLDL